MSAFTLNRESAGSKLVLMCWKKLLVKKTVQTGQCISLPHPGTETNRLHKIKFSSGCKCEQISTSNNMLAAAGMTKL